jgi:hypothetical protein
MGARKAHAAGVLSFQYVALRDIEEGEEIIFGLCSRMGQGVEIAACAQLPSRARTLRSPAFELYEQLIADNEKKSSS